MSLGGLRDVVGELLGGDGRRSSEEDRRDETR